MFLSRFISKTGFLSRRKATLCIKQGCVKINGKIVTQPSSIINPGNDRITFNNKLLRLKSSHTYLLLNKPKGVICTRSDPHATKTIYDLIPEKYRHLHNVGRLDKDTEGLLLLTTDGDLTYVLTHPKFEHEKEYRVIIDGRLTNQEKIALENGIELEDGKTSKASIIIKKHEGGKNRPITCLNITIHEGKKRQIKRMFQKVEHHVICLTRIRLGTLTLNNIKTGTYRMLAEKEIEKLKKIYTNPLHNG